MRVLLTLAFAILAGGALAQQLTLGRPTMSKVYVWTSRDALHEAYNLIRAKVHETNIDLLIPLLSCVVEPGTRAAVTKDSASILTIVILNGPYEGCRGVIALEDIQSSR